MQLSITELNDLLYCTRTAIRQQEALPKHKRTMDDHTLSNLCELSNKIYTEIDRIVYEGMNFSDEEQDTTEDDIAWPGNRKFDTFLEAVTSAEDAFGVELNIRSRHTGFTYEDVDGNPITIFEVDSEKAVMLTNDGDSLVSMEEFVAILADKSDSDFVSFS